MWGLPLGHPAPPPPPQQSVHSVLCPCNRPSLLCDPKEVATRCLLLGARRRLGGDWPPKDVSGDLMPASQTIRQADRVVLRQTRKDAFDLTSARVFLDDTQYQQRVVDLLKEDDPKRRAPNWAIKVYTVVHTMLLALTHLHTLWTKKAYLSDVDVEEAERWANKLGERWKLMGRRATVSVHWTVCHSGWFVRKYRTMYFLS